MALWGGALACLSVDASADCARGTARKRAQMLMRPTLMATLTCGYNLLGWQAQWRSLLCLSFLSHFAGIRARTVVDGISPTISVATGNEV